MRLRVIQKNWHMDVAEQEAMRKGKFMLRIKIQHIIHIV